ncbi:MAG: ECF transporter S component [Treponema sp.]|nr:ECF transporter S component [Treponema sp.]
MKNERARKIVIAGVFSALEIVLGSTGLGFIPLPLGNATIMQVPAIIAGILEGPLTGAFVGLIFGIFSVIQAALIGASPVDLAFLRYPPIALVPRLLIGPAAWLVYFLVSGGLSKKRRTPPAGEAAPGPSVIRETAGVILGAAAGSLTNTALVLVALRMVVPEIITLPVLLTLISLNGTVEAAFSALISLGVVLPWKRIPRRGGGSRLNSRDFRREPPPPS